MACPIRRPSIGGRWLAGVLGACARGNSDGQKRRVPEDRPHPSHRRTCPASRPLRDNVARGSVKVLQTCGERHTTATQPFPAPAIVAATAPPALVTIALRTASGASKMTLPSIRLRAMQYHWQQLGRCRHAHGGMSKDRDERDGGGAGHGIRGIKRATP